jgi:hypothetical protein
LLWGIGATLSVAVTWGFLENFGQLRHMDLYLVYPLFCVLFGLALGIQQMRYR